MDDAIGLDVGPDGRRDARVGRTAGADRHRAVHVDDRLGVAHEGQAVQEVLLHGPQALRGDRQVVPRQSNGLSGSGKSGHTCDSRAGLSQFRQGVTESTTPGANAGDLSNSQFINDRLVGSNFTEVTREADLINWNITITKILDSDLIASGKILQSLRSDNKALFVEAAAIHPSTILVREVIGELVQRAQLQLVLGQGLRVVQEAGPFPGMAKQANVAGAAEFNRPVRPAACSSVRSADAVQCSGWIALPGRRCLGQQNRVCVARAEAQAYK